MAVLLKISTEFFTAQVEMCLSWKLNVYIICLILDVSFLKLNYRTFH